VKYQVPMRKCVTVCVLSCLFPPILSQYDVQY
jgi:hypothetical protein